MIENHISREQFLIEFFGNIGGRELGDPMQFFTDEPTRILSFIEECTALKRPAFISVNPRIAHDKVLGIEKIFFDFDYADKTFVKKLEKRIKDEAAREVIYEKRRNNLLNEVKIFLEQIKNFKITPLVVKTKKGFHIYIYFDKIYTLNNQELYHRIYLRLQEEFLFCNHYKYKYIDGSVLGDYKRMCRIPSSIHEKNGEECYIVKEITSDGKIVYGKFYGIEFYKQNGMKENTWKRVADLSYDACEEEKVNQLNRREEREFNHKKNWEVEHGFVGSLRYCFQKAIDSGEANHQLRLALLLEAYWSGHKTSESIIDLFRKFHDFNEAKTKEQVEWFFKNKVPEIEQSGKWKPYRCSTLNNLNICIQTSCPIYQQRKKEGKKYE